MHLVFVTHAPVGESTAGACVRDWSRSDRVATEARHRGSHCDMHDSFPAGILAARPAGRISQDLRFASACEWHA